MARKVGPLTNTITTSGKSSGASGRANPAHVRPYKPLSKLSVLKGRSEEASCSRCPNRTNEMPPFCTWLKAEIPPGLPDDPECEGFPSNNLGTSKGKERTVSPETVEKARNGYLIIGMRGMGMTEMPIPLKANEKRAGKLVTKPSKAACPKTSSIQTALKLKAFKGSVVREKVCCGKPGCHCHTGTLHGPYPYLHYYSSGKVKRHYLSKAVSALLSHSTEELERMLHATL